MRNIFVLLVCITLLFSCKKNTDAPPVVLNSNEFTALITVPGRDPATFNASGSDFFGVTIDQQSGDTSIGMYGQSGLAVLKFELMNVSSSGTNPFLASDSLGTNYRICQYFEYVEESLSWKVYYRTDYTDSAGNSMSDGEVTFSKLTTNEIEGTFNILIRDFNGGELKIENGKFKGKTE
jgi:hypothetical protein